MPGNQTISIAVSSCLLGNPVRYDGSDCANSYIIGTLSKFLKLVPVCPENAIGLGTPRPPIELVMLHNTTIVRGVADKNLDVTREIACFAQEFRRMHPEISGFLLKSRSPSCGIGSTKLYDPHGNLIHEQANGMFAAMLSHEKKALPVTSEDRLLDCDYRLDFLMRVIAISRLQQLSAVGNELEPLIQYHHQYFPLLQSLSEDYNNWFDRSVLSIRSADKTTSLVHNYQNYVLALLNHNLDRDLLHEIIVNAINLTSGEKSERVLQSQLQSFREGAITWTDILAFLAQQHQYRPVDRQDPFVFLSEYCPVSLLAD